MAREDNENKDAAGNNLPTASDWRATHEMISLINVNGFDIIGNTVFNEEPGQEWRIKAIDNPNKLICVVGKEGIDVKAGTKNGRILDNHVHHTRMLGIYLEPVNGIGSNILVDGNTVNNVSKDGITLAVEDDTGVLKNATISNNVVYSNGGAGIHVAPYAGNGRRSNIRIINNTVVDNAQGGVKVATRNAEHIFVINNLSVDNGGKAFSDQYGTVSIASNNSYRGSVTGFSAGGVNAITNPGFVDAAANNYRLRAWSPVIDTGTNGTFKSTSDLDGVGEVITINVGNLVPVDADDVSRSNRGGVAYDVGAFEYIQP